MAGKQTPLPHIRQGRQHTLHHTRCLPQLPSNLADIRATDEVRRSGRANKGHHTKNADALDEPIPKPKSKPSKTEKKDKASEKAEKAQAARSQSAQSAHSEKGDAGEEEEEEDIIRCVCGDQRDIRGREMICCDICSAWQHNQCLNLPGNDYWNGREYYCEQCKPEDHTELLAAMARGEKPWSRKKSKKPPKWRPSDAKADVKQEKNEAPTPQPVQPPTPTTGQTTAQSPVPTPSAPPAPAPEQASNNASNGQAEAKVAKPTTRVLSTADSLQPTKKETPKSQPQSPVGEKRRHEPVVEKESTNKKRRKSSAPQEKTAPPAAPASDLDGLPPKQKPLAERLRDTLAPLITVASDSRGYRIPDGETSKSIATKFALQIDHAAVLRHGEPAGPESPFVLQLRSIMFNVKKNAILIDQLLSGSLKAEEFASMTSEEMASEEKQKEYAAMREANEKQMVLTEETGPRLRKTHKGEEIVGNDDMPTNDDYRAPPPRDRESEDKIPEPQSPARDGEVAVELPEDLSRRAPLTVETSDTQTDGVRRASTTFDINSVFDKVRSPQNDQQAFLQRRQSSIRAQEKTPQGPGVDADIDRLLKDEDGDVEMSGYNDPTIVWQGEIKMQQMEAFNAVARFVAGGDFGQVIPWDKLLSSSLPIQGRIESQKGDEYIRGLASTGSHDVCVLALSPVSPEARAVMDHLYSYFQPRDRWGVVPVDKLDNDAMRDLYLIPIPPGGSNLPPFLDMLEYCTIETPRKEHMMLLTLIAKLPDVKPQVPHNQSTERYPPHEMATGQAAHPVQPPNVPINGPSPSPLTNPHGPAYSPVGASFPPGPNFGNHYAQQQNNGQAQQAPMPTPTPPQPLNPEAVEILGPFIEAPVTVQVLQNPASASMSKDQLMNLRHIMENVPEARVDFNVFHQHLMQKMAPNGQS